MKLILISLIITLSLIISINLFAYNRVVVLAPAVGDIFKKLEIDSKVVGVTRHVRGFKNAVKVGSHIKPNIEIISSLKPDLIIISSTRFFNKNLQKYIKAKIYKYNPYKLSQILDAIKDFGKMFEKEKKAKQLILKLKNKLNKVKKLNKKPKVVFEIMQLPYIVSGKKDIVNDIIEKAGGINIVKTNKKHVRYSYEKVLALKPDIYIYQIGPMNKNPVPPEKREYLKNLKAKFIKIDERSFSRPNTTSFDNVLKLNKIFMEY
jgi:iron complex transport system substrate-binding protein